MKYIFFALIFLSQAYSAQAMNWLFKKNPDLEDFKKHIKTRLEENWVLSDDDIAKAPVRVQLGLKPDLIDGVIQTIDSEKERFKNLPHNEKHTFDFKSYHADEAQHSSKKTILQLVEYLQEVELRKLKYTKDQTEEINCYEKTFKKLYQVLNAIKQNHNLLLNYGILIHLKIRMGFLTDQGMYEHRLDKQALYDLNQIPEEQRAELLSPQSDIRKKTDHHRITSIIGSPNPKGLKRRNSAAINTILLDEHRNLVSNKTIQQTFPDLEITPIHEKIVEGINQSYKDFINTGETQQGALLKIVEKEEISLGYIVLKPVEHTVNPTEADRLDTAKREELKKQAEDAENKRKQLEEQQKKGIKNPAHFKKNPNFPDNNINNN